MKRLICLFAVLLAGCATAQFPPPYVHNYWDTNLSPNSPIMNAAHEVTNNINADAGLFRSVRTFGNLTATSTNTIPLVVDDFTGTNIIAEFVNAVNGRSVIISSNANISIGAGIYSGDGSGLTNLPSSGGTGISTNGGSGHNNNFTNAFTQNITNNGPITFKDQSGAPTFGVSVTNGSDQLYFTIAGFGTPATISASLNASQLASGTVPDGRLGIGSEVAGPFVTTNAGNASISHNAGGLTNSIPSQFATINNWTKAVATAANFNLNLPVTNYQAQIVGQGFTVNALTGFITNTSAGDYCVSWSWSSSANPAGESTVGLFTNSVSTSRTAAGFINVGRGMGATWFITLPANCGSSIVPLTGGGVNCTNYEFAIRRLQ